MASSARSCLEELSQTSCARSSSKLSDNINRESPIGTAMDWPLSREEKKSQLIRLYNQDVEAADRMLQSGEKALAELQSELDAVRLACWNTRATSSLYQHEAPEEPQQPSLRGETGDDEARRLRHAVESAAAVLRAILGEGGDAATQEVLPERTRSRSEGSLRQQAAEAPFLKPALNRTPRNSRGGTPKRRVSFGDAVEERALEDETVQKFGRCASPSPSDACYSDVAEPEPEEHQDECRMLPAVDATHPQRGRRAPPPDFASKTEMWVPADVQKIGLNIKLAETCFPEKVVVDAITKGTWAAMQGVRVGDILLKIGGYRLAGMMRSHFLQLIKERPLELVIGRPFSVAH